MKHEALIEVAEGVIVRPMLTINDAIDLFDGDMARRGLTDKTRITYRGILYELADTFPNRWDVAKLTTDDTVRFLDQRGKKHARGTRAHAECVLNSFFRCLVRRGKIKQNPVDRLQRTRRLPAEALDVTTVSSAEVLRLLDAAETWADRLCISVLAYLGPRRRAAARLRLTDYDRLRGRLRFQEKGGKVIWKPIPDPLRNLLDAAIAAGAIVDGSRLPHPAGRATGETGARRPGDLADRQQGRRQGRCESAPARAQGGVRGFLPRVRRRHEGVPGPDRPQLPRNDRGLPAEVGSRATDGISAGARLGRRPGWQQQQPRNHGICGKPVW